MAEQLYDDADRQPGTGAVRGSYGFTEATAIAAEGARVGLVTCERCGATILVDPRDDEDRLEQHAKWHQESSP